MTKRIAGLNSPKYITDIICRIHRQIRRSIHLRPDLAFKKEYISVGRKSKPLAAVDLFAEKTFAEAIEADFGREKVHVLGEEQLVSGMDLTRESRLMLLVDMVDGTDLLERGFSNWCSAVIIFRPSRNDILGAFVAVPSFSSMYYSLKARGSFKLRLSTNNPGKPIRLSSGENIRKLEDSTLCIYAQKASCLQSLFALSKRGEFSKWLRQIINIENSYRKRRTIDEVGFRFYNLAGNPMMAKLAEGSVDIVCDLHGQKPHDVAPGAVIALNAGASFSDLSGNQISISNISEALLHPADSSFKYILARNRSVLRKLARLL